MVAVWKKSLVYLGLAEEDELDGSDEEAVEEPIPRKATLRRVDGDGPRSRRDAVVRPLQIPQPKFHLLHPAVFDDAQELGDKFRDGHSVIMNLQGADAELGRRLIDFASGLVYGLGGAMQPIADRTFLLTPQGVQVSAEERRRFLEDRGFFNQA
jgi:cell division inhibitor SepF